MSNSLNPYSFSTSGLSKGGQEVGMYGRVSVGGLGGGYWGHNLGLSKEGQEVGTCGRVSVRGLIMDGVVKEPSQSA